MPAPFDRDSISLRLYPHNELDAPGIVEEMCRQGKEGLEAGFDGVMTSEHHGGVGGYTPNPLQMAGFILEETDKGWAAPCPLLLPLRPVALVAEEVSWLDARHPGRVGLGVASGAMALDFEAMGLDVADAGRVFKEQLPAIVDMLHGRELGRLEGDRALQRRSWNPIRVLSAAVSPPAARRAALCGAGILLEGMSPPERLLQLCEAFDDAGGTQPKILIRRVWLGSAQSDLVESQRRFYRGGSSEGLPPDQTVTTPDPLEMASLLVDLLRSTRSDGLNLRIHLPGMPPAAVREQIAGLASDVVPVVRRALRH